MAHRWRQHLRMQWENVSLIHTHTFDISHNILKYYNKTVHFNGGMHACVCVLMNGSRACRGIMASRLALHFRAAVALKRHAPSSDWWMLVSRKWRHLTWVSKRNYYNAVMRESVNNQLPILKRIRHITNSKVIINNNNKPAYNISV